METLKNIYKEKNVWAVCETVLGNILIFKREEKIRIYALGMNNPIMITDKDKFSNIVEKYNSNKNFKNKILKGYFRGKLYFFDRSGEIKENPERFLTQKASSIEEVKNYIDSNHYWGNIWTFSRTGIGDLIDLVGLIKTSNHILGIIKYDDQYLLCNLFKDLIVEEIVYRLLDLDSSIEEFNKYRRSEKIVDIYLKED